MIIAVDFDGTIVEHKFPAIGKEMPFAIEILKKLAEDGHKLILWTSREGDLLEEAIEYCKSRGVTFYAINTEKPDMGWDPNTVGRKIVADMYIDDRNLGGLPGWPMIYRMVINKMTFGDMLLDTVYDDMVNDDPYGRRAPKKGKPKYKNRQKGIITRLRERMREARAKINGGDPTAPHRHHW